MYIIGDYATIYLVNTFPALIIKLTGPYWFHYVPYNVRIITASLCIVLNFILVMYGSTTWLKLLGVFFGAVQASTKLMSFTSHRQLLLLNNH